MLVYVYRYLTAGGFRILLLREHGYLDMTDDGGEQ